MRREGVNTIERGGENQRGDRPTGISQCVLCVKRRVREILLLLMVSPFLIKW